jgi:hypothetical protein
MASKRAPWVETRDRFVAFLDVMGFKDRVYRDSHESIYDALLSFSKPLGKIEEFAKYRLNIGNEAFTRV